MKLGSSSFESTGIPQELVGWLGAHNAYYGESHWFGNPGLYQTFAFSINDSAPKTAWVAPWPVFGEMPNMEISWKEDFQTPFAPMPALLRFRSEARPNTYTLIGPNLDVAELSRSSSAPIFGPHGNHVRTIGQDY